MTVLAVFLSVGTVHAETTLNVSAPMPTVSITNATTSPCNGGAINGCWKTATSAVPGDVIAVHVYYENTGASVAQATTLSIKPATTGVVSSQTFTGGVASITAPRATGSASVSLSTPSTITYMDGTAKWYPAASSGARYVDTVGLFGTSGFNIGDIYPGEQGVLVANFRVTATNSPTDPINPNPSATCTINSFSADQTTVSSGSSTTVRWSTTGCDTVSIVPSAFPDNRPPTSAVSTGAIYSTTTYTITGRGGNNTNPTRSVTVYVNGTNHNSDCSIDSFTTDDNSITRGDSTRLRWSTNNCDYVTVTSVGNNLGADGSTLVSPTSTKTYTLNAYPNGGSARITVYVDSNNNNDDDECSIDSFYADSTSISSGSSTVLRWRTTGTDDVDITPGYLNRSEDGSVTIYPNSTTTYTIRVNGNGCSDSESLTVSVGNTQVSNSRPQAITTAPIIYGSNSAQLNGIAVPNTTSGNSTSWFEWGPGTNLSYRTDVKNVTSYGSTPYSQVVQGIIPGAEYYYRAVVQNNTGIAYGDIIRLQTNQNVVQNNTVVTNTRPIVTTRVQQVRTNDVVVASSQPSLLELRVASSYDRMCVDGEMDYTITYRNVSAIEITDAVLRLTLPKELTYVRSSQGAYESIDRVITIDVGNLRAGEDGSLTVRTRVNNLAVQGNLTVMTATIVYTNTISRAQEDAIAYSLVTVSNDCPNVLGASVFGFGSFLPDTLLEWLLLILVILALVVLGRQLYKKKEQPQVISTPIAR